VLLGCALMGVSFAIQRYCMTEPITNPSERIGPLTFTCVRLVFSTLCCYLIRPAVKLAHETVKFVSVKSGLNLLSLELDEIERGGDVAPPTSYEAIDVTDLDSSIYSENDVGYGISIDGNNEGDNRLPHSGNLKSSDLKSNVSDKQTTNACACWGEIFTNNLEVNCEGSSSSCRNGIFHENNTLWTSGGAVGITDGIAAILQQISLVTISGGKCAFITTMYVIVVPVISYLAPCLTNKMTKMAWVAAFASVFGLYLLSGCAEQDCIHSSLGMGDLIAFGGTLLWSTSIIIGDSANKAVDSITLIVVEFFISSIVTFIPAIMYESSQWTYPYTAITTNLFWLAAVGLTEGLAFTFSNMGQTYTVASQAALIMSMESVFAAITCYIFLGEEMSPLECLGGVILLSSTILISTETANEGSTSSIESVDDFDFARDSLKLGNRSRENSTGGTSLRSAGSPMPRSLNPSLLTRRNTELVEKNDYKNHTRIRSGSESETR